MKLQWQNLLSVWSVQCLILSVWSVQCLILSVWSVQCLILSVWSVQCLILSVRSVECPVNVTETKSTKHWRAQIIKLMLGMSEDDMCLTIGKFFCDVYVSKISTHNQILFPIV